MKVCIKNFNCKVKQWRNRKTFWTNYKLSTSTVNEKIKYLKCFPSNTLIRMFLFEIFVWMFLKFVPYFKFFLQVTVNIGKINSFQSNFTLLQIKYCINKCLYNGLGGGGGGGGGGFPPPPPPGILNIAFYVSSLVDW